MATKCKKPVYREVGCVDECGKHRPVIVSLEPPNVIGFRLKGLRRTFFLTVEGCYMQAVKAAVAAEKKEKAKAKGKPKRRTVSRGALK